MASRRLWTITLVMSVASAMKDSSPFFSGTSPFYLFSSSNLPSSSIDNLHIALSDNLRSEITQTLSGCPSDTYIVVSQPGVDASDYEDQVTAPHLQRWLSRENKRTRSSVAIPQVQGQVDATSISTFLTEKCKAKPMNVAASTGQIKIDQAYPRVVNVDFGSLPASYGRDSTLATHDSFLNKVLSSLGDDEGYTVIYTTSAPPEQEYHDTPHPDKSYEMDDLFPSALHTELKRDLSSREGGSKNANLPLFAKFRFFSPAIFMGLLFFFFFILLLYVAISALSGIKVSYYSFSKEMGPSAQKKQ